MSGYLDDPEATAAAIDADGWLHTGDVGFLDAEGNLAITDRLKDMYVSGGFNVYPAEVEAVLRRHPGVAQVASSGCPTTGWGRSGWPSSSRRRGPSPDDRRGAPGVRQGGLANFKVPRRVEIVDVLPANASGKVLKRELRTRFGS